MICPKLIQLLWPSTTCLQLLNINTKNHPEKSGGGRNDILIISDLIGDE